MSHRWEHGQEYQEIKSAFRRAQKEGNDALCEQLRPRIEELDGMMWASMTAYFTELIPYQTVVEALEQTATRLGMPFPDLTDPQNRASDGQFIFTVSDGIRTVQVWPMESRGHYDIDLFDYPAGEPKGLCYHGTTTALDEATIALSRWFMERCPIAVLQTQFAWLAREPMRVPNPRANVKPSAV